MALVDAETGRRFSYADVDLLVGRMAGVLTGMGLQPGDRVAAVARNSPELVMLQLACARAGLILAPLNWRLSPGELAAILDDCAPALLVGDDLLDRLVPDRQGARHDIVRLWKEAGQQAPARCPAGDPDRPSLMLYTSGTSGAPKGVPLSERNMAATAMNFAILGDVCSDSAFLADAPMFHVIGMVTNIRPALAMGGRIIVSSGFDPARTLARLSDDALGITHYFCVPQMAQMLRECPGYAAERLRGLKALFTGGAPHPEHAIRQWLDDDILAVDGYGMTEAGTVLGMPLDRGTIGRKAGSAGLLPPTIEHRVVDDEDRDLAPGAVGELLLRGPNITKGYWQRPSADEEAFTADGFFRTGDLVRVDEEGFFFLVGRKKDMFISGGENIYPAEVEAVLTSHPDVEEACVVGVPDARWGEVGHAVLVIRAGAAVEPPALLAHCEAGLARYKLPKAFHIVSALPRTGSGKLAKAEVRAAILASQAAGDLS